MQQQVQKGALRDLPQADLAGTGRQGHEGQPLALLRLPGAPARRPSPRRNHLLVLAFARKGEVCAWTNGSGLVFVSGQEWGALRSAWDDGWRSVTVEDLFPGKAREPARISTDPDSLGEIVSA